MINFEWVRTNKEVDKLMAKVTIDMPIEGVKELLAQLAPQELQAIFSALQNRMETFRMMKLSESAFSEWSTEEDLYPNA